eukprot:g4042.t1
MGNRSGKDQVDAAATTTKALTLLNKNRTRAKTEEREPFSETDKASSSTAGAENLSSEASKGAETEPETKNHTEKTSPVNAEEVVPKRDNEEEAEPSTAWDDSNQVNSVPQHQGSAENDPVFEYVYAPSVVVGDEVEARWGDEWLDVTVSGFLENGLVTITWQSDGSVSDVEPFNLRRWSQQDEHKVSSKLESAEENQVAKEHDDEVDEEESLMLEEENEVVKDDEIEKVLSKVSNDKHKRRKGRGRGSRRGRRRKKNRRHRRNGGLTSSASSISPSSSLSPKSTSSPTYIATTGQTIANNPSFNVKTNKEENENEKDNTVVIVEEEEQDVTPWDENVKALFDEIDTDKSGFLDADEIKQLAINLGKPMSEKQLKEAMQAMDPNGDQQVDFDEFSEWWEREKDKKHGLASNLNSFKKMGGKLGAGLARFRGAVNKLGNVMALAPPAKIVMSTNQEMSDSTLIDMIKKGRVSTICLDNCKIIDRAMEELSRVIGMEDSKSHTIRSITLRNASISNEALGFLGEGLEYAGYHLRRLDLHSVEKMTVIGLRRILKGTPDLESINLSHNANVTLRWCSAVSRHVSDTLQKLDLNHCKSLDDKSLDALVSDSIDSNGFPQLRVLLLEGCRIGRSIVPLLQFCPLLEVINLSNTLAGSDECLIPLAKNCPELTSVNVRRGDTFQAKQGKGTPSLSIYTDQSLIAFGSNCKNLLSVCFCIKDVTQQASLVITDKGVTSLAEGCHELMEVDLTRQEKITDASLIGLSKYCPNLGTLKIPFCKHITDKGIIAIVNTCTRLVFLDTAKCYLLSDKSAFAIGKKCKYMEFLNCWGWQGLTDNGVVTIAKGCRYLQNLGCYDCTNLSNKSLASLASNCQEITGLGICCNNITVDALRHLLRKCRQLKNLDLQNSRQLEEKKLQVFVKEMKKKRIQIETA